jgi:hypothetical protein
VIEVERASEGDKRSGSLIRGEALGWLFKERVDPSEGLAWATALHLKLSEQATGLRAVSPCRT